MREKYESLSLAVLKDLAKARGMKGISTLKKADLIERMLEQDKKDEEKKAAEQAKEAEAGAQEQPQQKPHTVYSTTRPSSDRQYGGRPGRPSYGARQERGDSYREKYQRPDREPYQRQDREPYQRPHADYARPSYRPEKENVDIEPAAATESQAQPREEYEAPKPRAKKITSDGTYENHEEYDSAAVKEEIADLDSGMSASGILEVMSDGFGFIRCENYLPGEHDVYVAPSQIRRFNLKSGDIITGNTKIKTEREKFAALLYVTSVNGYHPSEAQRRPNFEDLTPIFPDERLRMERPGGSVAMRVMDIISPIGKGQRGMIVSQPKAGKTTLIKEIAKSVTQNNPEIHLIILLIDERPEEVTDIKEAIVGDNVEVIYSTFDETAEHHKRVSEMVIERARRLVEHGKDVMILLDSITRLARAYNLTVQPSGRTLSGGLDPAALHMPKRFFGAARNMREGGSLTILATALVETGSKMDDVVYEEFKGTGNMELILDRKLSEKRIFPAVDIARSGTRRDDLLLDPEEKEGVDNMRRALNGMRSDEAVENILNMFAHTKSNAEFIHLVRKNRIV
ncbi:MAG: transcription termination factor Rho [Clostridiales bacterium]|nr:transcription termination factor Rho [Clostridiales bacterium]